MNLEAEGLGALEAMRKGVDYEFTVRVRNFTCKLRPLTNGEVMEAYSNANEYMQKIPVNRRTKMMEDQALARNFLMFASSPFGTYAPALTDPILSAMTPDEMMAVYREWQAICDRVNPALETMEPAKLLELVDHLKKNPPEDLAFQLTQLSFGQLVSLAQCLLTKSD